jgi:hypothetical protein
MLPFPSPLRKDKLVEASAPDFSQETWNILLTHEEVGELVRLIDDREVDEEFLGAIRKKLVHKQHLMRNRARKRDGRSLGPGE